MMRELPAGVLIGLALVFIGCALVAAGWITCIVVTDRHHKRQMEEIRSTK